MSPVTAEAVAKLRARTGVSMMAVKQALDEAAGDEEKAIEILRKRGIAQAVKKADREQSEGALFSAQDNGKAVIVQVKCETDFVARGDDFQKVGNDLAGQILKEGKDKASSAIQEKIPALVQKLGENISVGVIHEVSSPVLGVYVHSNRKVAVVIGLDTGAVEQARDVAMHAAAMNPLYAHPDDVPAEAVAKEKEIWKEQMKNEKKPPEILEKIMLGKERKFKEENSLIKQQFVKDNSKTVEQYLGKAKVVSYLRVAM